MTQAIALTLVLAFLFVPSLLWFLEQLEERKARKKAGGTRSTPGP